jgi:hypothetical protein
MHAGMAPDADTGSVKRSLVMSNLDQALEVVEL